MNCSRSVVLSEEKNMKIIMLYNDGKLDQYPLFAFVHIISYYYYEIKSLYKINTFKEMVNA